VVNVIFLAWDVIILESGNVIIFEILDVIILSVVDPNWFKADPDHSSKENNSTSKLEFSSLLWDILALLNPGNLFLA
jgi:hypothetical protein